MPVSSGATWPSVYDSQLFGTTNGGLLFRTALAGVNADHFKSYSLVEQNSGDLVCYGIIMFLKESINFNIVPARHVAPNVVESFVLKTIDTDMPRHLSKKGSSIGRNSFNEKLKFIGLVREDAKRHRLLRLVRYWRPKFVGKDTPMFVPSLGVIAISDRFQDTLNTSSQLSWPVSTGTGT